MNARIRCLTRSRTCGSLTGLASRVPAPLAACTQTRPATETARPAPVEITKTDRRTGSCRT